MDVVFEKMSFSYMEKTPLEKQALKEIHTTFPSGTITAIIGKTGSGKSTLVQHINGLLKPTAGRLMVGGQEINPKTKRKHLESIRKRVGMVFQYPEHQLFEETVEQDILFGPKNYGLPLEKIKRQLPGLLEKVGLDNSLLHKSPFELSGGQMRRVAIAGVLTSSPDLLILDEPTASLDPQGKKDILALFKDWHDKYRTTIILITHDMEEAADLADRTIVMNDGTIAIEGPTEDVFEQESKLRDLKLNVPDRVKVLKYLSDRTGVVFSRLSVPPEKAAEEIESFQLPRKDTDDV